MIYPGPLTKGDLIGVTAPSDGDSKETDSIRLDNGINKFKNLGYEILETNNVRTSHKGRSSSKEVRAKELMSLYKNEDIKAIISSGGGDYLVEVLSLLDFDAIKENLKWYQGYSDNTGIVFTITTNLDIATLYGENFGSFGMEPWHHTLENNLRILEGEDIKQKSYNRFQDGFRDRETGLEGFLLNGDVKWRNIHKGNSFKANNRVNDVEVIEEIEIEGRALGGCLDVLLNLVGTRFDKTKEFVNQYKEDGVLWYLESFSLGAEALTRGLWQLKEAGWFEHAKGFIFGRPAFFDTYTDTSYDEAVLSVLKDLDLPIILDGDIGHRGPQFTMINGAMAKITSKDGKGSIVFERR